MVFLSGWFMSYLGFIRNWFRACLGCFKVFFCLGFTVFSIGLFGVSFGLVDDKKVGLVYRKKNRFGRVYSKLVYDVFWVSFRASSGFA